VARVKRASFTRATARVRAHLLLPYLLCVVAKYCGHVFDLLRACACAVPLVARIPVHVYVCMHVSVPVHGRLHVPVHVYMHVDVPEHVCVRVPFMDMGLCACTRACVHICVLLLRFCTYLAHVCNYNFNDVLWKTMVCALLAREWRV
jgi:hypothetical protein